MDSSSKKEKTQTTLNSNYQKELRKLFTENNDLQRQVTELYDKIETLLSNAVKIQQENNQLKKEINSKPESSEMNRRLAQVEEQFNKIATYTQEKIFQHQSIGDLMDIQIEQIPVQKQRRIPRCWLCKRSGYLVRQCRQFTKSKRQKKQNNEIKQINYTAYNKDKYIEKFYQGWELHEAITEANNIRMRKIFQGAQGHILLQEEEQEEENEYSKRRI